MNNGRSQGFEPRRSRRRGRAGTRPDHPVAAANLVAQVLKARGVGGAVREHRLVTSWTEIVGERIAARSFPTGLSRGVLHVQVSNSAWMQELSFLREAIARAANDLVGAPPLVKDVRLHLPGRTDAGQDPDDVVAALARRVRRRQTPRPVRPLSASEAAQIDGETQAVADPELRSAIRALRQKLGL